MVLEETEVQCPYCGEPFAATVDCPAGSHRYVEDCPVCCRPIEFTASVGDTGELLELALRRDDE